jgi:MoxR-like ATPase
MAKMNLEGISVKNVEAVLNSDDVIKLKEMVSSVHVSDEVLSYIQRIVDMTRSDTSFALGASPRALLHLLQAARARAFLNGSDFVKPDDVKYLAPSVLSHRLVLSTEMRLHKKTAAELLELMILKVPVSVD